MQVIQYIINAFTRMPFGGNPAAVVPLKRWLPDNLMQQIATENSLSETAFFVPEIKGEAIQYALRWFTPFREVDFCGHATLAAAHVLLNHKQLKTDAVTFTARCGELKVKRFSEAYQLDFPRLGCEPVDMAATLSDALGVSVIESWAGDDLVAIVSDEATVANCTPDMAKLKNIDTRGVIISAANDNKTGEVDFVSRFFAPRYGIEEDPVTGSAHCLLAPLWAEKLGKPRLSAKQVSKRGGEMICEVTKDRVLIDADAVTYMIGKIYI